MAKKKSEKEKTIQTGKAIGGKDEVVITSNRGKKARLNIVENSNSVTVIVIENSNYSPSYLKRKIRGLTNVSKQFQQLGEFVIAEYYPGSEVWTQTNSPDNGQNERVTLPKGTQNYWNDTLQCGGRKLNYPLEVIYIDTKKGRCKSNINFSNYKVYQVI